MKVGYTRSVSVLLKAVENESVRPGMMDRLLMIRAGMVAVSGFMICTTTKPIRRTPKRVKRAMMRPFDHAYVVPPHWSARRRQTMQGRRKNSPRRSSLPSCCRIVRPF